METNNNRNTPKTFAFGLIGGLVLAAALGAGLLLGGTRGSGSTTTAGDPAAALRAYATAAAGNAQPEAGAQNSPSDGAPVAPQSQPAWDESAPAVDPPAGEPSLDPTATPVAEEPETEEPEVTPTSTPSCNFCGSGDIAIAPTATPDPDPEPCPFCVDAVIGTLIDVTPPVISNIETSFCFPILVVSLEVDAPAEVWFEYDYEGNTYASIDVDAANDAFIPEDLGGFGWGVYFISNLEVHAVDLSGNHAVVDVAMPEPDLVC